MAKTYFDKRDPILEPTNRIRDLRVQFSFLAKFDHCVHNCNQPYDEMHQGLWLRIKFGFPQTGKGSPSFFEIGWQTPEIH